MAEETPSTPAAPPAQPTIDQEALIKALRGPVADTAVGADQWLKQLAEAQTPGEGQLTPPAPQPKGTPAVHSGQIGYPGHRAVQPFSMPQLQLQATPQIPVGTILAMNSHQLSPQTLALQQRMAMLLSQPHGIVPGTRG